MQIVPSTMRALVVTVTAGLATLSTGGAAVAATIPNTTLQPSVWLDAGSISGLNSGDAVATWADSSGFGRNATQGTALRRPTYQVDQANGHPVVRFNTVLQPGGGTANQFLAFPGALANTPSSNLTLFVVSDDTGLRTSSNGRGIAVNTRTNSTSANGFLLGYGSGGPTAAAYAHVGHSSTLGGIQTNAFGEDDFNLFSLRRTADVTELATFTDVDSSETTATWTTTNSTTGNVGFNPSTLTTTQIGTEGGQHYLFGDIAEIIAFEGTLSDADRAAVNQYLGGKYAIQSVPEPTSLAALAAAAGAGLLARRRRVAR